jgi:hypothetical protein
MDAFTDRTLVWPSGYRHAALGNLAMVLLQFHQSQIQQWIGW